MLLKGKGSTWDSEVDITSGLGKQELGWWVSKPCLQLYKNEDVLRNGMVSRAADRDSWTVRLSASYVKSSRVWDLLDITCIGLFHVAAAFEACLLLYKKALIVWPIYWEPPIKTYWFIKLEMGAIITLVSDGFPFWDEHICAHSIFPGKVSCIPHAYTRILKNSAIPRTQYSNPLNLNFSQQVLQNLMSPMEVLIFVNIYF